MIYPDYVTRITDDKIEWARLKGRDWLPVSFEDESYKLPGSHDFSPTGWRIVGVDLAGVKSLDVINKASGVRYTLKQSPTEPSVYLGYYKVPLYAHEVKAKLISGDFVPAAGPYTITVPYKVDQGFNEGGYTKDPFVHKAPSFKFNPRAKPNVDLMHGVPVRGVMPYKKLGEFTYDLTTGKWGNFVMPDAGVDRVWSEFKSSSYLVRFERQELIDHAAGTVAFYGEAFKLQDADAKNRAKAYEAAKKQAGETLDKLQQARERLRLLMV